MFLLADHAFMGVNEREGSNAISYLTVLQIICPSQSIYNMDMRFHLDILQCFLEKGHQGAWGQILIIHLGIRYHTLVGEGKRGVLETYESSTQRVTNPILASSDKRDNSPLLNELTFPLVFKPAGHVRLLKL